MVEKIGLSDMAADFVKKVLTNEQIRKANDGVQLVYVKNTAQNSVNSFSKCRVKMILDIEKIEH